MLPPPSPSLVSVLPVGNDNGHDCDGEDKAEGLPIVEPPLVSRIVST